MAFEPTTRFVLEYESELRVHVGEKTRAVKIELENGKAEICGTQMLLNKVYELPPNVSIGVFSWQGCTLKLTGNPKYVKTEKETLMILNTIMHACLQEQRNIAQETNTKGPVTLVVGPTDVGKTTLCQTLLNYAARMEFRPIFVDLDVGQSNISIPGSVGILCVDKPADIVEGFEVTAAKVYHFGYKSPSFNLPLYFLLLKHLANVIKNGLSVARPIVRSSGVIINTCGWVRGHGYDIITHAAMAFEVDRIVVIGEERLQEQLTRDVPASVKVEYMPRLSGAVERSKSSRIRSREARILNYFYGSTRQFSNYTITVPFSDVRIYTIPQEHVSDDAKIDSLSIDIESVKMKPVSWSTGLKDQVLALMKVPKSVETVPDDLVTTEVLGYVMILDVNMKAQVIQIKSPQPNSLPSKYFLMGDRKFNEHIIVE
ncbi:hypothetical protein JTE90_011002 [Oedothorax gibbosus]|uniref:Protein CLP1 homolog n=1 Tax=Oedothorax gibbosus TaxID=931172 RepID=A0AAV6VFI5_9ARAC|nr:hypothetical protein JTE90_011002 [Oedothorax gibbosus]